MAKNTLLAKVLPHLAALLIFLVVTVLYFLPQIEGKVIQSGDVISYEAMSKEINDHWEKTGERSWWTNGFFGGMPTYQINGGQPTNVLKYLERAGQLFISRPIGYFFAMCLSIYIFMLYLGINPWLSMIGALCFSFSTGNMTLYEAGHITKLRVAASFGFMAMGLLMTFRKDLLRGGILFALGLGLNLYANHVQMTYYFFLALGIYVLVEAVNKIRSGEAVDFGKALVVLMLATGVGMASSASKLWVTYEYGKDTMRGEPILVSSSTGPKTSSETNGLDWNYAMQWSNGLIDLASVMIPGVAGGSAGEKLGPSSELYQFLKKRGANIGANFRAPLYWGALPSTSGPFYFGAIFCFLFILGLILIRGPLKWWLGIAVLLMLLASMGKEFPLLNRPLFDYFPFFNKFRTPNSILTVTGFFIPVLGMLVVSDILRGKIEKAAVVRGLKIALGITGGICLFFILLGPSFFDFASAGDARLAQAGYDIDSLVADRKSLMRSDSLRSLVLMVLSAGLIWAFVEKKIQTSLLIGALGLLAVGDLMLVDKRYLDSGDFIKKSAYENSFKPRPVDLEILKDPDPHYRVLDLSINTFNSAKSSYFHKTIGGYNAAKLQRFDDIINYHLSKGNQEVLAMLNTKYVITQDQKAQRFPGLGNAWMARGVKMVNTPNEEIEALTGFKADSLAIVHQEYADYVSGLNPTGSGTISMTEYRPDRISYTSNSSSEELAVFSEVWYGPDKGWEAYIDGQSVDHIRVNYILRGLKIPAGQHQIEFKFEPQSYYRGETITSIFSMLLLLAFLGLIAFEINRTRKQLEAAPQTPSPKPKKVLPKTKSKGKKRK